jgi:hypothetical protein
VVTEGAPETDVRLVSKRDRQLEGVGTARPVRRTENVDAALDLKELAGVGPTTELTAALRRREARLAEATRRQNGPGPDDLQDRLPSHAGESS